MVSRYFQLFILFAFFLEVVNPSTSFVREQFSSIKTQKIIKAAKKSAPKPISSDDPTNNSSTDDEDDYFTGGAIMPVTHLFSKPSFMEVNSNLEFVRPPQPLIFSIHEPPRV